MKLEEFLWRYCGDHQSIVVQVYESNHYIQLTDIFKLNIIDIFSNHDKYRELLERAIKDVEAIGDNLLKITVWTHWIKFKED